MPDDWASSGARLSLPVEVIFTDEPIAGDLRWTVDETACCPAKQLQATPGRFVGKQGEVGVPVRPGGWLAEPADRCGQKVMRFYLDFPDGAQRNDAVLPEGRVFFHAACWDGEKLRTFEAERAAVQAELDASLAKDTGLLERVQAATSERAEILRYQLEILQRSLPGPQGVIPGPGGVQLAAGGVLSVKANSASNLWGALGDRFHIIGRFSFTPIAGRKEQRDALA